MSKDNKIIVILGQTSTGKSDFAVEIAKNIKGEIISADSRQVYKGMNLGTGKITKKEMQEIPHYLLDVASPSKVFTVNDFKKIADKKIKEIFKKNKTPILCGGTGFYIDTVINGTVFPDVKPDHILRTKLEKKTKEKLFEMLEKLDPERSKNIDKNNKVRLIRAIEISKALGKVPKLETLKNQDANADHQHKFDFNFNTLKIGLMIPDELLKEKINIRLLARIKKGMLKEMQNLHKAGLSWKRMEALGLEYRYGAMYLQGKINKDEMLEKINTETWHYAKRQKTWFKRDISTIWIDPRKNSDKNKVLKRIKEFLK